MKSFVARGGSVELLSVEERKRRKKAERQSSYELTVEERGLIDEVKGQYLMWGDDWTKLSVSAVRWYLLTVIEFFSRWIIAWEEEIGGYIERYHHHRPHQSLMNFTPAHVHELSNKSLLLAELKEMKRKTREKRKAY